ncbi:hypothetical protein RND81_02G024900 [Saponaria officinalis]|uniref:Integrase catalytic domain-containing protein n=1 Tax=Saponaria officinalis TaxID=3572 RepID=A0AAW1MR56_SAPOF
MTSDASTESTANNTASLYEDPYYLAPGDNGNLQLVSTPFDGKHYLNWSRAIKMALISKNKYCFVSGACAKPKESDKKLNDWIRVDYTVLRWLMLSISPTITNHMMYVNSSKQLWDEIKERYNQSNAPYLYQLRKSMVHIEQSGQPVVQYFGRLKSIWEDLSSLDPLPECDCDALKACTCNILKKIVDRDNKNRLLDFLMGLDGVYEVVRDQILSTDPLPTVNQAFFKIQQLEMQGNIHSNVFDAQENVAMAANKSGHLMSSFPKNPLSSSAGDVFQCSHVQLVGNRDAKRGRGSFECDFCGKKGHTRAYCFKLKSHNRSKGAVRGEFRGRMAAHVEETHYNAEETPLGAETAYETDAKSSGANSFHFDPAMVQAFYQEVQKMMQNKGVDLKVGSAPVHGMNLAGMAYASNVEAHHLAFSQDCWIIDSGASDHMTHDFTQFISTRPLSRPLKVTLPDGMVKDVNVVGDVVLQGEIVLKNVLYLPEFKHKLLSVGKILDDSGLEARFYTTGCVFQDHTTRETVCFGKRSGGVYRLCSRDAEGFNSFNDNKAVDKTSCNHVESVKQKEELLLFHSRLGHSSLSKLRHVPTVSVPKDTDLECEICVLAKHHKTHFPLSTSIAQHPFDLVHMDLWGPYKVKSLHVPTVSVPKDTDLECEICVLAKHHKTHFPLSTSIAQHPFDLVHMDLWGPYKVKSLSGGVYFFTILDDCTRVTWTSILKDKTEVYHTIVNFLAYVITQFSTKVKIIRSDNGTEIINTLCASYFLKHRIVHQKSLPGVPQQNGRVERKHRHLLDTARALRFQSGLPKRFWGELILSATHLINLMPSSVLNWKTPVELLFGRVPDYSHLRTIGCLCYSAIKSGDKFDQRARKCIFLGYPFGQKGYKLFDLEHHKLILSRDVIFREHIFPYKDKEKQSTSEAPYSMLFELSDTCQTDLLLASTGHSRKTRADGYLSSIPLASNQNVQTVQGHYDDVQSVPEHCADEPVTEQPGVDEFGSSTPVIEGPRKSTRHRQQSVKLHGYICKGIPASLLPSDTAVAASDPSVTAPSASLSALVSLSLLATQGTLLLHTSKARLKVGGSNEQRATSS